MIPAKMHGWPALTVGTALVLSWCILFLMLREDWGDLGFGISTLLLVSMGMRLVIFGLATIRSPLKGGDHSAPTQTGLPNHRR